jgi:hypothetical protein
MAGTALEERDEAVAEAIISGRSLRAVRREFSLSAAELDAVLERMWPLDTAARLRTIRSDLGRLDRLIEVFFTKACGGDVHSGMLVVKAWERKAGLLGLDAVQRIDLQIMNEPKEAKQGFDQVYDVIMRLARPDWQPNGGDGDQLDEPPASDGDGNGRAEPSGS